MTFKCSLSMSCVNQRASAPTRARTAEAHKLSWRILRICALASVAFVILLGCHAAHAEEASDKNPNKAAAATALQAGAQENASKAEIPVLQGACTPTYSTPTLRFEYDVSEVTKKLMEKADRTHDQRLANAIADCAKGHLLVKAAPVEAEKLFISSLSTKETLGLSGEELLPELTGLERVLLSKGRFNEAITVSRRILAIHQAQPEDGAPSLLGGTVKASRVVGDLTLLLNELYFCGKKFDAHKLIPVLEESILTQKKGTESPWSMPPDLLPLAEAYYKDGNYSASLKACLQAQRQGYDPYIRKDLFNERLDFLLLANYVRLNDVTNVSRLLVKHPPRFTLNAEKRSYGYSVRWFDTGFGGGGDWGNGTLDASAIAFQRAVRATQERRYAQAATLHEQVLSDQGLRPAAKMGLWDIAWRQKRVAEIMDLLRELLKQKAQIWDPD